MKKKAFVIILSIMLIAAFCLTSCGNSKSSDSSTDTGKNGTTLVVRDEGEWTGIDMYQSEGWYDMQGLVADTVLAEDPDTQEAVPRIASKSVWSDDGLTWTLTFPKGMYYSTGEELEPEDFVASVKYGQKVSPYADGYSNIKSMEVSGRDVIMHLKKYQADTEFNFESCFTGIIDKDEIEKLSKDDMLWGCHPYGAYYVDEYQPGAYVMLKANEKYKTNCPLVENKGACPIKTIKIVFSGEGFTLAKGVETGDYDVIAQVDSESYDDIAAAKNIKMIDSYPAFIDYAVMNITDPLFKDKNVRKAIVYSISRDNMSNFLNVFTTPAYSLILPKVINYSKDAETYYKDNYSYDKAKAEKLLKAAGWIKNSDGILEKNGKTFTFTYTCQDDATTKKIAQSLQSDFKAVGIEMKIETKDWSYVSTDVHNGDFQMARLGFGWGEPMLLLDNFYSENTKCTIPDPSTLNAMITKVRSTTDFDSRTEQVLEIQKTMFDYCSIVPLANIGGYRCWRSEIKGIVATSVGGFFLNDVVTDKDGNFRNVSE